MVRSIVVAFALATVLASCGIPAQHSTTADDSDKMDADVGADQLNIANVFELIDSLNSINTRGSGEVSIVDIFAMLKLSQSERALIEEKKSIPVPMTCSNAQCGGQQTDQSLRVTVQNFHHPDFGSSPTFIIDKTVIVKTRVLSADQVEICHLKGVKVANGFLTPAVKWGLATRTGDTAIVKLDIGPFGTYERRKCP